MTKLAVKNVSSVFTQYVCLFVCEFVCLSVVALQTSSFNKGGLNFDIDTYKSISYREHMEGFMGWHM